MTVAVDPLDGHRQPFRGKSGTPLVTMRPPG
jgi:hypothetical protein